MALKPGRIRIGTWFDKESSTLKELNAFCKERGMSRGGAIRSIVIEWLGTRTSSHPNVGHLITSGLTDEELERIYPEED